VEPGFVLENVEELFYVVRVIHCFAEFSQLVLELVHLASVNAFQRG
jgi:hypothetical protein